MFATSEDEGDEGRAAGFYRNSELPGDVVAEAGGANLGDGQASGGNDQRRSRMGGGFGQHGELLRLVVFSNLANPGIGDDPDTGGLALLKQHGNDLLRGAVAEKLAQSLLVIADTVLFDQRDEV